MERLYSFTIQPHCSGDHQESCRILYPIRRDCCMCCRCNNHGECKRMQFAVNLHKHLYVIMTLLLQHVIVGRSKVAECNRVQVAVNSLKHRYFTMTLLVLVLVLLLFLALVLLLVLVFLWSTLIQDKRCLLCSRFHAVN